MIHAALLLVSLASWQPPSQGGGAGAAVKVAVVQQHLDLLVASVRQAKEKPERDPQALTALEKEYADTLAAFEKWQTAAHSVTATSWVDSRKRIEDLSKTAARAIAECTRDARAYFSGRQTAISSRVVGQFERELVDAARALADADDQVREQSTASLSFRPWNDIRAGESAAR